ncbi:basic amino acid ABC transporter substrate-binding protein [soil metagenome]
MRKINLKILLAALVAIASLAVGVGCGSSDDSTSGSSTGGGDTADFNLIKPGTLVVGSDIPYPPFEDGRNGDYTGFDIDLVGDIAEKLGLTVEVQDTNFTTIFRDLSQGKFDLVASASTITPERQKTVDFSDPYYEAQQAILVAEGSDIKTADDLNGKTVGAQDGTTGEAYVTDKLDAKAVRPYPEAADAINALRNGQIEAAVIDQPVAQDAVDKGAGSGLVVAGEISTDELYGLAIAKDNTKLLDAVNGALQDLKDDGTLNDLYQQYFKIDAPDSVINGTTESK